MNAKLTAVKNHVQRNKNAYRVAALTLPVIYLQHKGIKSLNSFLDDKGLTDEYYTPEDES